MEILLHPKTAEQLETTTQPGAYIVHGPKGAGKTTAVEKLHRQQLVRALEPEDGSIKVAAVNDLNSHLKLKNWSTARQTLLIDGAESLTTAAQNALLKSLEELPADVSFILVADDIDSLLPTIRSRCRHIYFQLPSKSQVVEWVRKSFTAELAENVDKLDLTAPGFIANLAADKQVLDEFKERRSQIEDLFSGSVYSRLQVAAKLQKQLPEVMNDITSYVRLQLRRSSEHEFWIEAASACEQASRLLKANANKRYILDVIAIAGNGSSRQSNRELRA